MPQIGNISLGSILLRVCDSISSNTPRNETILQFLTRGPRGRVSLDFDAAVPCFCLALMCERTKQSREGRSRDMRQNTKVPNTLAFMNTDAYKRGDIRVVRFGCDLFARGPRRWNDQVCTCRLQSRPSRVWSNSHPISCDASDIHDSSSMIVSLVKSAIHGNASMYSVFRTEYQITRALAFSGESP